MADFKSRTPVKGEVTVGAVDSNHAQCSICWSSGTVAKLTGSTSAVQLCGDCADMAAQFLRGKF